MNRQNNPNSEIDKDYKFVKDIIVNILTLAVVGYIIRGIIYFFKDANKAQKRRILRKWRKRLFYLIVVILFFIGIFLLDFYLF